jgi:glutaconyl-CoA/methylmalonyl-CoA decarboxylase subunit delta
MWLNFLNLDLPSLHKPTVIIVLAGQIIVAVVLFVLYKFYTVSIPFILRYARKQNVDNGLKAAIPTNQKEVNDDVYAAIAMALYLHFNEIHDEESNVITIQRISKAYSPWSSKIYNMRNFRK